MDFQTPYNKKNTQPHTLGCKTGCDPYKTLNISVDCGAGGTKLFILTAHNSSERYRFCKDHRFGTRSFCFRVYSFRV